MAKKKEETIEAVETEEVETVEVEKPKKSEWKIWTESELAVLPREEYLKAEEDIRLGKASVKKD